MRLKRALRLRLLRLRQRFATRTGAGSLWLLVTGGVVLASLVALRLADPLPLQAFRQGYFDLLQRVSPREATDASVRIVDIDEASLARLGQWPWPRDVLADLVTQLANAGAAVVALDILLAEPDRLSPERLSRDPLLAPFIVRPDGQDLPDRDTLLAEAMRQVPVAVGSARAAGDGDTAPAARLEVFAMTEGLEEALPPSGAMTPVVPILDASAAGIGSINVAPGSDSAVVRRVPLLWNTPGGTMPALSIEALRLALGEGGLILWDDPENAGGLAAIGIGPFDVPVTRDGLFLVHFRLDDPGTYIPAWEVLEDGFREDLSDQIVFVGTSAAGLLDIRATALGQNVAGVSIHAQVVEQILTGRFLTRTDYAQGLEVLIFIALSGIVISVLSLFGPMVSVIAGGVAAAMVGWVSWYSFRSAGILLDVTFALAGGFFVFSMLAVLRLLVLDRHTRFLRRSFSRYVGAEVLREVEKTGSRIELGGEQREITIMFADIVGFTPLSQTVAPKPLVALLNDLFTELGAEILKGKGTIDKYLGDGLMAFWNAPVSVEDHARRACATALKMQSALGRFNEKHPDRPIRLGIGLARGEACIGNIGSREHFNFTAIGERVNVAARIEGTSRVLDYDVAADGSLRDAVPEFAWLSAGLLELKGMARAQEIFALAGDAEAAQTPAFRELEAAHKDLLAAIAAGEATQMLFLRCERLAAGVSPFLPPFYRAMAAREVVLPGTPAPLAGAAE